MENCLGFEPRKPFKYVYSHLCQETEKVQVYYPFSRYVKNMKILETRWVSHDCCIT